MTESDTPALAKARRRRRWWTITTGVAFVAYIPLHATGFPLWGPVGGLALCGALNVFWLHGWIEGFREHADG